MIEQSARTLSANGGSTIQSSLLPPGSVMMSCIATVGRCGITTAPSYTNQQINALILRDGVNARFVYYAFKLLGEDLEGVGGGGSVYTNVSKGRFSDLTIPLPSGDEQRRLANTLGALDDKIDLNRRMNETLEAIAQAIFRDWFIDFGPVRRKMEGATDPVKIMGGVTTDTDEAARLANIFPATLADNGLPEGWEEGILSDLVELNPTEPLKKGVVAPYTDMAALPTSGPTADRPVPREFGSGMRFRNRDALLARITPCLENGKSAYVDFLPDNKSVGWGSTEFIVLRARPPVPSPFAYLMVRHPEFRERAIQSMTGTPGRQRAQADALSGFAIAAATTEIYSTFGARIEPMFEMIRANAEENQTLAAMRDLLLPKLMSGEIRLKDAEKIAEAAE